MAQFVRNQLLLWLPILALGVMALSPLPSAFAVLGGRELAGSATAGLPVGTLSHPEQATSSTSGTFAASAFTGCVIGMAVAFSSARRRSALRATSVMTDACLMWSPVLEGPKMRIVVFGGTGYIGRATVEELARRGHSVVVVTREKSGPDGKQEAQDVVASFSGIGDISVATGNVADADSLDRLLASLTPPAEAAVCCLASRGGGRKDSFAIDYQATVNCMHACNRASFKQFVLLSAVCVQKPLLAFQEAKLKAEKELQQLQGSMMFSIVQPTAFFKSLLGQIKRIRDGSPYVMFGDGTVRCKPISEQDLASFIADCVWDSDRQNKVLKIGGPPPALAFREQGNLMFELTNREPKFWSVPYAVFDFVQGILDFFASLFPDQMTDAAEYGRIGRYYAEQSMLVMDPTTGEPSDKLTPSYGTTTLKDCLLEALQDDKKLEAQRLGQQAFTKRIAPFSAGENV